MNKNESNLLVAKLTEAKEIISAARVSDFKDLEWGKKGQIFDLFCPELEPKRYGYGDSYSASEGFFFDCFAVVFVSACHEWHEWSAFKYNMLNMYLHYYHNGKEGEQCEATLDEIDKAIVYLRNLD